VDEIHSSYDLASKCVDEDDSVPEWYKHDDHVLIFTYSGKPVWSRYGSEDRLSAFTGTLSAIVSKMASLFVHSKGTDSLRYIKAGDHIFAFMERGPLWLVSISRGVRGRNKWQESIDALQSFSVPSTAPSCPVTPPTATAPHPSDGPTVYPQHHHQRIHTYSMLAELLDRIHQQLICILTRGIDKTLKARPSYDVRALLGGTDAVLNNLIEWSGRDMFALVDSFEPLPLAPPMRVIATNALKDFRAVGSGVNPQPHVLAAILLAHHRVVTMAVSRVIKNQLHPTDLVILINLVRSSALRQSESWTPVCLPHYNDSAFLYAYVNFSGRDLGLVVLSSTSDGDQFYALSQHFHRMMEALSSSGCLDAIRTSIAYCPYALPNSLLSTLGVPFIHVGYFLPSLQQYFGSAFSRDYQEPAREQQLFSVYHCCKTLLAKTKAKLPCQLFYKRRHESFFVWQTAEYHLYCCAPRWTELSTHSLTQLVQWLKTQESFLFISNIPTL